MRVAACVVGTLAVALLLYSMPLSRVVGTLAVALTLYSMPMSGAVETLTLYSVPICVLAIF